MGGGGRAANEVTLANIKRRLFTKEDYPHPTFGFHKILGIGCLLHFIFRFVAVMLLDDMGFSATWQTAAALGAHALLSVSSLIFRIPKKRIVEGSRIWPEYRLHSIIFACRSLACMALTWAEARYELPPAYGANAVIVLATLAAADIATWSVGEASRSSTIRDLDAPPFLQYFFSVMQFHATAGCLLGVRRFSTQFVYVWIIQFTAFLMTLRRKNLAPHTQLVWTYGAMLSFGFVVATSDALSASSFALLQTLANTAAIGRIGCRLDKYVLWTVMAVFAAFARQTVVSDSPYAHLAVLWPFTWAVSVVGVLLLGKAKLEREAAKLESARQAGAMGGAEEEEEDLAAAKAQ